MKAIGLLLIDLIDELPPDAGSSAEGLKVQVERMDLELPLETRIRADGTLLATAPRGRLATGFDPVIGKITINFERGGQ